MFTWLFCILGGSEMSIILYAVAIITIAAVFPECVAVTPYGLAIALLAILLTKVLVSLGWIGLCTALAVFDRMFLVVLGIIPIEFIVHMWVISSLNQRVDGFMISNGVVLVFLSLIATMPATSVKTHSGHSCD